MSRDLFTAFVTLAAAYQLTAVATPAPPAAKQTSANATNAGPAAPADPAAVVFKTPAGLVLHAVRPAAVPDYEAALVTLQGAFAKSTDDAVRKVAASWRVFKAAEADAKGSVLYVHWLQPVDAGVDYRPSLWLDDLLAGAPADLLAKYRDAFAVAPTKLSLTEFAQMSVAPVVKANASPDKPLNKTPR